MMFNAVVSGGSGGIGLAVARMLAERHGASVTILGRDGIRAAAAALELAVDPATNQQHRGVACDVRDAESVRAAFAVIPPPRVLVHAAGVAIDGLLVRTSDASIADQLDTNLTGAMYLSRAALRGMLTAARTAPTLSAGISPSIVLVGSVVGSLGNRGQTVYAASKAGLVGLTKALAAEVGPKGVRVNCVAPGFIDTAMTASLTQAQRASVLASTPLGALGAPEDVAEAVDYLLRARFVTGTVLTVDGGLSVGLY